MSADEADLRRLQQFDDEMTRLSESEQSDPRISFDYEISDRPIRKDSDGTEWYRVRLFVSPKAGFDLNDVSKVVYVLHPTFSPSQVAVSNPRTGFGIQIESWGDFHAMAVVVFKNTETRKLVRFLPIGVRADAF